MGAYAAGWGSVYARFHYQAWHTPGYDYSMYTTHEEHRYREQRRA